MALPHFKYHEPESLTEACQMIKAFGKTAALLAGGTDLLVKMRNRERQPQKIVSLTALADIRRIDFTNGHHTIGACCTVSQIAESVEIQSTFPALACGAGRLGSPAVRNVGTIGGNIVTASPAADLPPALVAYGATVRLKSEKQERVMPLENLFRGPGDTQIIREEILAEVHLEKPPEVSGSGFFKLGSRRALQISVVNGACYLALNPQSGEIEKARVVLGAVAPTLVRAFSAENILVGQKPGANLFLEAGRAAALDCRPIDDLRASAVYRRDMVQVMTSRTLHTAMEEIRTPLKRS